MAMSPSEHSYDLLCHANTDFSSNPYLIEMSLNSQKVTILAFFLRFPRGQREFSLCSQFGAIDEPSFKNPAFCTANSAVCVFNCVFK